MDSYQVERPFTDGNFDEAVYLAAHPDVAHGIAAGWFVNGREHFKRFGKRERRRFRDSTGIEPLRAEKLQRLEPLLRLELEHVKVGRKYDFLTAALRAQSKISATENVGCNDYDAFVLELIRDNRDGLILDCGSGRRQTYYRNVVNYEIVDYDTTDVLGVGEELPFKDDSFDGVISIAVLEHVRDPFRCARELMRVLKPKGRLVCCVPFLQPMHGYPHHYYNMSPTGLRSLFEGPLVIDDQKVMDGVGPVWSLTWIVQSWAAGLPEKERKEFLSLRLKDLMGPAAELQGASWVKELPVEKNFELASATILLAHKPPN